jgi:hypothetical protein
MSATVGSGHATSALVDVRVRSLMVGEARRRAMTGMFGVPAEQQSLLVTLVLLGAAGTVLRGLVPGHMPHPHGADAAIGGAVLNSALRGMAGSPSSAMPLAGALIALAMVSHSVRPTAAACVREIRRLPREFGAVLGVRHRRRRLSSEPDDAPRAVAVDTLPAPFERQ